MRGGAVPSVGPGFAIAVEALDRLLKVDWEAAVGWLAVLAVLVAVAAYVIGKVRPKPIQEEQPAAELLRECREMHLRGELSDAEYRTIKTTLTAELRKSFQEDDETG
jgi:hypothetical protein